MMSSPAPRPAIFEVGDMSCAHCEATIRAALGAAMPGTPVGIDLARHRVTVEGDAELAAATMRDAGYEPSLLPG